jgi:hypothetical protein
MYEDPEFAEPGVQELIGRIRAVGEEHPVAALAGEAS